MTIRKKLSILVILPVIACTSIAVIIAAVKISDQGIKSLTEKSADILEIDIREFTTHHQDGSSLFEQDDKTSQTIANETTLNNYSFHIASLRPENPKHLANDKEAVFIKQFEETRAEQKEYIDKESNSIWVMRPVFMDKSRGCLECHGSRKSDKIQISENALRGIFVVSSKLNETQSRVNSAIFKISLFGLLVIVLYVII